MLKFHWNSTSAQIFTQSVESMCYSSSYNSPTYKVNKSSNFVWLKLFILLEAGICWRVKIITSGRNALSPKAAVDIPVCCTRPQGYDRLCYRPSPADVPQIPPQTSGDNGCTLQCLPHWKQEACYHFIFLLWS